MSITENKELVLGFFDDIAKGNIQGALDRMTEDLRFTLIGTTRFSGVFKSRKEFVDRILAPLAAQLEGALTITTDNLIAEGDYVVAQSHGRLHHACRCRVRQYLLPRVSNRGRKDSRGHRVSGY